MIRDAVDDGETTPARGPAEAAVRAGNAPMCDEERSIRLRRLAAAGSMGLAGTLVVAKLFAAFATDSVAVLSTLLDSAADLAASVITVLCISQSVRPPSRTFRFGRGKAEPLSALGQSAFIGGSGLFIVFEAVMRLIEPQPLDDTYVGIAVMLLALVLTGALVVFQRRVVRLTGSPAIEADSMNYLGDLVTGTSVLLTLVVVSATGVLWLDPLVGLAVAAYLLRNAVYISRDAVAMLLDRELPIEDRRHIKDIVLSHTEVRGMHDLRTRSAGTHIFIELHLEIDGALSLEAAHGIADRVESALREAFPSAEIIIHQEPAGLNDERLDDRLVRK
jgi:ferrous-iron efflux pump FieF